jgi:hypothetical protein
LRDNYAVNEALAGATLNDAPRSAGHQACFGRPSGDAQVHLLILAGALAWRLLGVLFGLLVFLVVLLTIVPFSHSSFSC